MSCENKKIFTIKRGWNDTYKFIFRDYWENKITDPITWKLDYPRVDITWFEIYLVFRAENTLSDVDDTNTVINKTATIVDAVNWIAEVSLNSNDTNIEPWTYIWAVSYKDLLLPVASQFTEQVWYIYLVVEPTVNKIV